MLATILTLSSVVGHGAMTFPTPRNAIDGQLPAFKAWKFPCDKTHTGENCSITFCGDAKNCQGSCPKSAHNGVVDDLTADNGQSCYWFNNGCMVGCDVCDGTNNHYGHGSQAFLYNGLSQNDIRNLPKSQLLAMNPWAPPAGDSMYLDPKSTKGLHITPNCKNPTSKPTMCAGSLRTMNVNSECGGPDDVYFYSPWRAPGAAPVIDSCGVAGGRHAGQGGGGAGADYMNTTLTKQGDLGSRLPPLETGTSWSAGVAYEVGWTVSAHHGGGYAYRLAPADGPLTEEVFRKTPLDFVGNSILRWGGDKATQLEFNTTERGWETNVGTTPAGSTWRKFPVPTVLWGREGPSFEPVCEESDECKLAVLTGRTSGVAGICKCSGHSNGGPLLPNLEVVDNVMVPEGLAAGKYVLQWRWDCEETDQIWISCADVTVTHTAAA